MSRALQATMLVGMLAVGVSCGGKDGNGPVAGNLKVQLTSPHSGADSAIVFTVTGPGALTSATAGAGLRVFSQPLGGTTTRFALTGRLTTATTILTIGVENINAVAQYSGTVEGVALPDYSTRVFPGASGYTLTIIK